jgi:hypothetical protein
MVWKDLRIGDGRARTRLDRRGCQPSSPAAVATGPECRPHDLAVSSGVWPPLGAQRLPALSLSAARAKAEADARSGHNMHDRGAHFCLAQGRRAGHCAGARAHARTGETQISLTRRHSG